MQYKIVYKFISRLAFGLVIAIFLGRYIDAILNTSPFIVIALIAYVVIGSLILLVKEAGQTND